MFSVDYPFEEMEKASAWFDQAPISESTHAKISRDNAVRLLKLRTLRIGSAETAIWPETYTACCTLSQLPNVKSIIYNMLV
jgi:hypothetical protein